MVSAKKADNVAVSTEKRREMAKVAFYGGNERLADHIKNALSYEMNDRTYPANGFDLAEAIRIVGEMPARELLSFIENPTFALMQDETELISGDESSIKIVLNNITGRNLVGKEHSNYLAWVKSELKFPGLMPEAVFITVK